MDKKKVKEAIALLNSMVKSGEDHTATSTKIVKEALQELQ